MTIQPQVDIKFLEEILNDSKEKKLDEFTQHKVYRAIQAYQKINGLLGVVGLASYYIYFNQSQKAIDLMQESIKTYGYHPEILNTLSKAYQFIGDMHKQIEIYVLYFQNVKPDYYHNKERLEDMQVYLSNLINMSIMYFNNSEEMQSLLSFIPEDERQARMDFIALKHNQLAEIGISLKTYQKAMSIVNRVVHFYYHKGFMLFSDIDPRFGLAQIGVVFDEITPLQAFELNLRIDEAIVQQSLEDEIFANEIVYLSIECKLAQETTESLEVS